MIKHTKGLSIKFATKNLRLSITRTLVMLSTYTKIQTWTVIKLAQMFKDYINLIISHVYFDWIGTYKNTRSNVTTKIMNKTNKTTFYLTNYWRLIESKKAILSEIWILFSPVFLFSCCLYSPVNNENYRGDLERIPKLIELLYVVLGYSGMSPKISTWRTLC